MSRALRIVATAFVACICQTTLVGYIRIAGVAPDMLIVFLVLLTGYTGAYGGFCTGSVMAMLYDASVGYVLAINLVAYTFIGWAAPMLRSAMDKKLRKMKHKSVMELMLICFFLTLMREMLYIGYLFLIGSEQGLITIVRMLLCSAYSAAMILPGSLIMRLIMRAFKAQKRRPGDLEEEDVVTETHR